MYAILGNIVRKNGMLSHAGNAVGGWGIGIVVIAFSCSFEYDNYGGPYQYVFYFNLFHKNSLTTISCLVVGCNMTLL